MSTAGYLQDAKNQQKRLAETITSKGITATATEKYKDLVDKVAQIENLKGEERTLENFTNVLSEPKSIVQLEYPEPKNLFNQVLLTDWGLVLTDGKYVGSSSKFNGKTLASNFQNNNQYTISLKGYNTNSTQASVLISVNYTDGTSATVIRLTAQSETEYKFTTAAGKTVSSFKSTYYNADTVNISYIQIEKGTTATPYEPYPAPKTLNAKLGSKNLIPYPYAGKTSTSNGITFTVNDDGSVTVNGTATANATFELESDATMFALPVGNYFLSGCPNDGSSKSYFMVAVNGVGITYDKFLRDFGNGISVPSKGEKWKVSIRIISGYTADNLVFKPQIELGSTATPYTPYVSDLSTVTVTRYGKNLFDTNSAVKLNGGASFSVANNVITVSQNDIYKYSSANVQIPKSLIGKTITLSAKSNTSGVNVAALRIQWVSNSGGAAGDMILGVPDSAGNIVVTGKVPTQPDETHNNLCLMFYSNSTGTLEEGTTYTATYSEIQIELGSTATEYEPYQGQTYTPTASGEVTGITNLYPTTTLLTNNAGVVFEQVTGGSYKEILPSTDKNGITKVYQPSVDSTIDSNIISDNIKQGVSILGVTGNYICNYTYDETTKELVLIL